MICPKGLYIYIWYTSPSDEPDWDGRQTPSTVRVWAERSGGSAASAQLSQMCKSTPEETWSAKTCLCHRYRSFSRRYLLRLCGENFPKSHFPRQLHSIDRSSLCSARSLVPKSNLVGAENRCQNHLRWSWHINSGSKKWGAKGTTKWMKIYWQIYSRSIGRSCNL